MSNVLGIPCWSWGGSAPGGWAREYLEWLARYRHTGLALEAPGWSCWIDEWPSWTQGERVTHVRVALASLAVGVRHEAHRTHNLRMRNPLPGSPREWSRLALTARLAANMTLSEVMRDRTEVGDDVS